MITLATSQLKATFVEALCLCMTQKHPPNFSTTDWDRPLQKMFRRKYKDEVVELDGNHFIECTFENVTMRYQGRRPYMATKTQFIGTLPEISVKITSDNPLVGQIIQLFNDTGMLKNKGDLKIFPTGSR